MEIEEKLFADDAFFEQVQAVKRSLLEREAAHRLPPAASAALALQLERSPQLQQEMQWARFQHSAATEAASVNSRRKPFFFWPLGLGMAVAALLAVAIFATLRMQHPPAIPMAQAAPVAQPAAVQPSAAPSRPPVVATVLFLPAGVLRGPSDAPALRMPDAGRPVELQIQVRGSAASVGQWSATLDRLGQPVVNAEPASVRSEGSIRYVSLPVAPGLLTPGEYSLTLAPTGSSGSEPVVTRTFTLRQR